MNERIHPEAMKIALLKEIQEVMLSVNNTLVENKAELQAIRKGQEKSNIHLKYEVDLSVARTNKEIADFVKEGVEITSIHILPIPFAMSIRLRGLSDEPINLAVGESYDLSGHLITRILVTNTAGSGTAYIHVYGR